MKYLFALSTFALSAQALSLSELEAQAYHQLEISGALTPELRALTQTQMGLLNDYGCWCYFEENHGKGKGRPADALDALCKKLHDGYECIIADMEAAGTPCIPWTIPYSSAFGGGLPGGLTEADLVTTCEATNGGAGVPTCESMACKVEGMFVQDYFLYSLQGGVIDASKRHANNFDVATECPTTRGVQSEKDCCGAYPNRYPFKTYDGQRSCCQSSTYNANMFSCCNDGSIRVTCPP